MNNHSNALAILTLMGLGLVRITYRSWKGLSTKTTPKVAWNEISKANATTTDPAGAFIRSASGYRNQVGTEMYPVESKRYILYVSYACPWASRCLIYRSLLGLEDAIPVVGVNAVMHRTKPNDPNDSHLGWVFPSEEFGFDIGTSKDISVFKAKTIRDIYEGAGDKLGKYSVPILFDTKTNTIVNNESSEIIRMMNDQFRKLSSFKTIPDFYPLHLRAQIDELNSWIYDSINNGVYKAGFAESQEAYDVAVTKLFESLERVEEILKKSRYLTGNQITEADIRLFTTLIRFDCVYHFHFKCTIKRLRDFPNLWGYTRDIYQHPNVKGTVFFWHIIHHYYRSHAKVNKFGIIPKGLISPSEFELKHERSSL